MNANRDADSATGHSLNNTPLDQTTDLPSPPFVIARVLSVGREDEQSVESLAAAIEVDQAFSVKVLRVANSAFYGQTQRVYTVRDAILLIGYEAVTSLAIAAAAVNGVWVESELFDRKRFWIHSLSCGLFAEVIARRQKHPKPDAVFTLGVLHDIGRVIMIQTQPELYRRAIEVSRAQKQYLWKSEEAVFGFQHADVGARLARKWNLPEGYAEAIQYHHGCDSDGPELRLARIVALADALSHNAETAGNERYLAAPLYRSLWEPVGLDEAAVREVRNMVGSVEKRTAEFYETATL
jgi:putative nucleotidyltransferase with HDIG domain